MQAPDDASPPVAGTGMASGLSASDALSSASFQTEARAGGWETARERRTSRERGGNVERQPPDASPAPPPIVGSSVDAPPMPVLGPLMWRA